MPISISRVRFKVPLTAPRGIGEAAHLRQLAKVNSPMQRTNHMGGRRRFSAELKAKVMLEALEGHATIAELAAKRELHPTQIAAWKREAVRSLPRYSTRRVRI